MQAQRANRRRTAALIAALAIIMGIAGGYAPAQAADDPEVDQTTATQTDPAETPPDDADPAEDEISTENDQTSPVEPADDTADSDDGDDSDDTVQKSVMAAAAAVLEAGDTTIATRQGKQVIIHLNDLVTNTTGVQAVYAIWKAPVHGTAFILGNDLYYQPGASYHGIETFEYRASVDSYQLSDTGTITIEVDQVTAYDDYYTTSAGATVTGNVLGNDLPSTPGVLSAFLDFDRPHHHGTLELTADGNFTYTPDPGFVGVETFGYWVTRSYGGEYDEGTVSITVGDPGAPPTAEPDHYRVEQNTVLNGSSVLANDTSASTLTAALGEEPEHGTLNLAPDGTFTYRPDATFHGSDYFMYTATDQQGRSSNAQVNIDVLEAGDGVTAADISVTTFGRTAIDIDTQPYVSMSAPYVVVVEPPANGAATVTGETVRYDPGATFEGIVSFGYSVHETGAGPALASGTITVTVEPAGAPPFADQDFYATPQDTTLTVSAPGVLSNDTFGDGMYVSLADAADYGVVDLKPDGSFTYEPDAGYSGTDSFNYWLNDPGTGFTVGSATVFLTVTPTDIEANTPIAGDDSYTVAMNTVLTVDAPGVLANDTIPQDPNQAMYAEVASGPAHGTLELNRDGSFTYTPDEGFSGTDSFTYTANDPGHVGFVPLGAQRFAPLALAAAATPDEVGTVTLSVRSAAADPDTETAESPGVAALPPTGAPAGARQLLPLSFLLLAGGLLLVARRRGLGR